MSEKMKKVDERRKFVELMNNYQKLYDECPWWNLERRIDIRTKYVEIKKMIDDKDNNND